MAQFTEQDLSLAQEVVRALVQYDRENTTDYSYSLSLHESGAQVLAQVLADLSVAKVNVDAIQTGRPSFGPEVS